MEENNTGLSLSKQRGRGFNVILILSLIMLGFRFLGVSISLISGQLTQEELKEQQVQVLEFYSEETIEMLGDSLKDTFDMMSMENDNFMALNTTTLITVFLGFLSLFWMSQLRKQGFYLYVFYTLLPLIPIFIYYEGYEQFGFSIMMHITFGGLFCVLYGRQLKKMH